MAINEISVTPPATQESKAVIQSQPHSFWIAIPTINVFTVSMTANNRNGTISPRIRATSLRPICMPIKAPEIAWAKTFTAIGKAA